MFFLRGAYYTHEIKHGIFPLAPTAHERNVRGCLRCDVLLGTAAKSGTEEGEKPTEAANKCVAKVLEQQQQPQSTRKRKAIIISFTRVEHVRRLESTLRSPG